MGDVPGAMDILFYALLLILPLSALAARRLPIGQVAKMATAWIAIFLLLLLLVAHRERFRPIGNLFAGIPAPAAVLVGGGGASGAERQPIKDFT